MQKKNLLSLILRLVVAIIFLQTLYFKFTGHPDSVHIFSALGLEPYGRIGLGVTELITSVLILLPRTKIFGILLSFGIILGAIFSHFLVLGLQVQGDGGGLFTLALVVMTACLILLFLHKKEVEQFIKGIFNK
ncbi:MAG: DoxX family protein [Bacteroidota bacterium]